MRDFELEGITLLISSRDHSENWRCEPDTVANVNSVLKQFIGSRYFHNYTSGTTGGRGGGQYVHLVDYYLSFWIIEKNSNLRILNYNILFNVMNACCDTCFFINSC